MLKNVFFSVEKRPLYIVVCNRCLCIWDSPDADVICMQGDFVFFLLKRLTYTLLTLGHRKSRVTTQGGVNKMTTQWLKLGMPGTKCVMGATVWTLRLLTFVLPVTFETGFSSIFCRQNNLFFKWANPASFLFIFVLFWRKIYRKLFGSAGFELGSFE